MVQAPTGDRRGRVGRLSLRGVPTRSAGSALRDHPAVRRHTSSQGVGASPSSAVIAEESMT
jgi:hypothetical protein